MTTSAKREFKRFAGFYQKGELQGPYLERLKQKFETGLFAEEGVVDSWFESCKEQYGEIKQPQVVPYEILKQSTEEANA